MTQMEMTQESDTQADKRKRVNLTLTLATHGRIKVWCAQRGVTLQSAIEGWCDRAAAQMDPPQ
jgi:ParG protein